ncbi:uncharacterized protein BDZ99DRAFT_462035 [Mytilinidion resinicola]|uniref:Uncharacterized protein n=1 Tax=Mytilinidion resinicola TaxID=574789 RepID=A0A6A6YQ99_9PEZI|nr:uncharacterized protein BDZ99DRAFT_462035 [Mytilinidion resinicola]KAF2810689.1 hypothetical protein BDZ99DRAFT_462035 [Mytilinidion resinicola]
MSAPASAIQHQILAIANNVAYEHALSTRWSTWHFWKHYHKISHTNAIAKDDETLSTEIRQLTSPFGSCVDIAFQTTAALRAHLASEPSLQPYAAHVQTLARPRSTTSADLVHCITALFEEHFCIVIDFSCSFTAMAIALNDHVDSLPYLSMDGKTMQDRLHYCEPAHSSQTAQRTLTRQRLGADALPTPFTAFDDRHLIRNISFRIAELVDDVGGVVLPRAKGVKLHAQLPSRPTCIPSVLCKGTYFATTCRVKADFAQRQVVMQVPYQDWMLQPANASLRDRVSKVGILQPISDAVCRLVLKLDGPRDRSPVKERVGVLGEVAEAFGLPNEDFGDMVDSVYGVWAGANVG